jgi:hypothetical protein
MQTNPAARSSRAMLGDLAGLPLLMSAVRAGMPTENRLGWNRGVPEVKIVRKKCNFLDLVEISSISTAFNFPLVSSPASLDRGLKEPSDNEFAKGLMVLHGELHEIADG